MIATASLMTRLQSVHEHVMKEGDATPEVGSLPERVWCCFTKVGVDANVLPKESLQERKRLTVNRNAGLALQRAEVAHAAIGSAGRRVAGV